MRRLLEAGADPLNGIYPHRDATNPLAMAQDRGLAEVVAIIEEFLGAQRGTSDRGMEITAAVASGSGGLLPNGAWPPPKICVSSFLRFCVFPAGV